MNQKKSTIKLFAGLLLAVCIGAACSDSTSSNGDAAAESEIESRWAAIVEIATSPNPLQDADVEEFKEHIAFPFTIGGRINDDPYEEEVITEEEFDQHIAHPEARSVIINSMVLISTYDIVDATRDPDIRVSGNSATRTVTIPVPALPELELGSHVSHWVRMDGEWYLQGVDLLIEEPEL